MERLTKSVKSAAVAVVLAAMASASAAAGDTTPQTEYAIEFTALARIPVTALSTAEMAETTGTSTSYPTTFFTVKTSTYDSSSPPALLQYQARLLDWD